jgi:hypothetical protein
MSVNDPEPPLCPVCRLQATVHPAGHCLDRWVHVAFLQQAVENDLQVPPYSAMPQQRCLDAVTNAPRWPDSFAVIHTSQGSTVGRRVRADAEHLYFHIVAAADNLPLAICRAAVCAALEGGDRPLMIV